jgi:hypothetical protein
MTYLLVDGSENGRESIASCMPASIKLNDSAEEAEYINTERDMIP